MEPIALRLQVVGFKVQKQASAFPSSAAVHACMDKLKPARVMQVPERRGQPHQGPFWILADEGYVGLDASVNDISGELVQPVCRLNFDFGYPSQVGKAIWPGIRSEWSGLHAFPQVGAPWKRDLPGPA